MDHSIRELLDDTRVGEFCERNHIRRLSLFGSALGEDFNEGSDVDLLVEFHPDHVPGLFGVARMEEELSHLLGGRKVDLRTAADLSRYFRTEVVEGSVTLYAGT
jgi:predicted nucleotidyltransferase